MSAETKHTPRPWKVKDVPSRSFVPRLLIVVDTEDPTAHEVIADCGEEKNPTIRANADLIASTPDLLAVVRDVADTAQHADGCAWSNLPLNPKGTAKLSWTDPASKAVCNCYLKAARAAIAAAEGRQP